ncbi:MAG: nitroreductase family deazaflavin-dependent oxidoreductase [Acidimicrobiia bacterium]|nr:nitroreductase family deazaflavin-dependent oxidoreductase [Acidimicrobiia bacterium]
MPLDGEYEPSPWDPVRDQVEQYERTGGREGGTLEGRPCVILTTRGRRSGKLRKVPLMRVEHDGRYAVVASLGGAPKHPEWYLNLVADPGVTLQDHDTVLDLRARTASPEEKEEWWGYALEVWPPYDEYQANTERDIPVVILEPAG